MGRCYIFDVDGTLTEPREKMNPKFAKQFVKWSQVRRARGDYFYIATGSDFSKTKQQLPQEVLDIFDGIFCCMGNELRDSSGKILKRSKFIIPDDLSADLERILVDSEYTPKTGTHIEFRTGMVNFSTVGRNASTKTRKAYNKWDSKHLERQQIADYINKNYPNLEASVGGSISIDIIEKGKDKGQIIPWLIDKGFSNIIFFGDRCFEGGNDWGIVRELQKCNVIHQWFNIDGPSLILPLLNTLK